MTDTKQFLDEMMPRIHQAETALHNGDAGPRFEMWSHTDPVTVFGAAFNPIGWAEVGPMFEKLASRFSNCSSCEWEMVAADVGDDFAYLLAIEPTTASVGGSEPTPYILRRTLAAFCGFTCSCYRSLIPRLCRLAVSPPAVRESDRWPPGPPDRRPSSGRRRVHT